LLLSGKHQVVPSQYTDASGKHPLAVCQPMLPVSKKPGPSLCLIFRSGVGYAKTATSERRRLSQHCQLILSEPRQHRKKTSDSKANKRKNTYKDGVGSTRQRWAWEWWGNEMINLSEDWRQ